MRDTRIALFWTSHPSRRSRTRYLIAIAIGITGSLLVFDHEISDFQLHRQIGTITSAKLLTKDN
ncbi:MAG: hypothetical protein ACRDEA_16605 [Microcystaceae cyanobacterium]